MIKPENKAIRDRILGLADKLGIEDIKKGGKLAKALGVHNTVIKRLLENSSLPGAENLKKICEKAEVSADYILFGKKSLPQATEFQEGSYDARIPAPVDISLFLKVIRSIDAVLTESRLKCDDVKKYRLAGLIYEHCSKEKERPDSILVKRYLLLID